MTVRGPIGEQSSGPGGRGRANSTALRGRGEIDEGQLEQEDGDDRVLPEPEC